MTSISQVAPERNIITSDLSRPTIAGVGPNSDPDFIRGHRWNRRGLPNIWQFADLAEKFNADGSPRRGRRRSYK